MLAGADADKSSKTTQLLAEDGLNIKFGGMLLPFQTWMLTATIHCMPSFEAWLAAWDQAPGLNRRVLAEDTLFMCSGLSASGALLSASSSSFGRVTPNSSMARRYDSCVDSVSAGSRVSGSMDS